MTADYTLLSIAALMAVALMVQPLAGKLRLPFTAVLLLTGFIGSTILTRFGLSISLDYIAIHDLVFYGLLPLLVFAAGFRVDTTLVRENLTPVAALALPMPLITCLLTAALIWWGIGHPAGFPWSTAVVAGAILTATEPFPLRGFLARHKAFRRIRLVMEFEGLINIAFAVVLYDLAVAVGTSGASRYAPVDLILTFCWSLGAGAAAGVAVSLIALRLSRRTPGPQHQSLVAVVCAYLAFLGADQVLGGSGVVAGLICGWFFGRATRADFSDAQEAFQTSFWDFLSHITAAIVFLVIGVSFTLELFQQRWLAMLIAIAAVLLVRAPQTLMAWFAFRILPGVSPLQPHENMIAYAAGLRGAVACALALALPTGMEGWWTVHALVFGVVFFTLVIQAPLVVLAIERLAQKMNNPEVP